MRVAEKGEFPYLMSTVCYIEVFPNGQVFQRPHKNKSDKWDMLDVCDRVKAKESVLYAVWPGRYSSDLFIIDAEECEERFKEKL